MTILHEIAAALELKAPRRKASDEQQLLQWLTEGLGRMLARNPDALFAAMYRLDVSEFVLAQALNAEKPAEALALAVYQRQLQKAQSRAQTPPPADSDPELSW